MKVASMTAAAMSHGLTPWVHSGKHQVAGGGGGCGHAGLISTLGQEVVWILRAS